MANKEKFYKESKPKNKKHYKVSIKAEENGKNKKKLKKYKKKKQKKKRILGGRRKLGKNF